ncbi:uncharacterized protein LOC116007043 isoform X1 [Ipomoea triloba]|uniref:uncharacterized protein LOC116007043 isoform X1 n=1 Tax=Ipomoea triloba TaxID=35885 RepID=UPI00125DA307|nr:uncharacterized protein LOC116007043 isoform X1 [Ipomoea triloba]
MRLKSGYKVEVMNTSEVPISWHTAEVLSGNDHTYTVRYDSCSMFRSPSRKVKIPRKLIRPCPPPVRSGENWVVGDLVEVCLSNEEYSWKVACVLKVLRGDHYLVRLLGCSEEFSIHRSQMRSRQYWQDGKWVLLPKGSGNFKALKAHKLSSYNCHKKLNFQSPSSDHWANVRGGKECFASEDITRLQDSHVVSSRSLKRESPYYSSTVESYPGNSQKLRALETNCKRQRVVAPSQSLEKVDAVAYPRETLGEKYMHTSVNVISNGYNEMYEEKLHGVFCHSSSTTSEFSDSDSGSSVGSCSVASNSQINPGFHFVPVHRKVSDALVSDAESVCPLGDEDSSHSLLPDDGLGETIHRLELQAYRCTLQALYASGPLTWEKEALLTNLLTELHISDDEHLTELKNLISAKAPYDN